MRALPPLDAHAHLDPARPDAREFDPRVPGAARAALSALRASADGARPRS
jgi:hypothetical protein